MFQVGDEVKEWTIFASDKTIITSDGFDYIRFFWGPLFLSG